MIRPILVVAAAATILTGCAGNSADHREILRVTESFFDAMERQDADLASQILVPEGAFISARRGPDGERTTQSMSNADWIDRLTARGSAVREKLTDRPLILVEGDVAMLWGEYLFEIDGEPSHTGIDVIAFVRTRQGWKIAGGAYSVIPVPPRSGD